MAKRLLETTAIFPNPLLFQHRVWKWESGEGDCVS